ncbi:zinc transporter ZupT [Corynebacterium freiburgense]|uniref:zinc transporter ZupT n=1 Tax=Corynebacterium freiburgense TaxID=556548 RepID=UPI000416675A|nr:zinc transporter ZupT [Corynebacterium freiburgense]WJZ02230.1 Zinc transporter ZupT [Corynebacterium freiburgense]
MAPGFWFAFSLTLLAGLSTGIGGLLSVLWRTPGNRFLAGSLGFSAGVMLYVSLVELLPEGMNSAGAATAVAAFFGGIAVIAIIDRLVPERVNPHEPVVLGAPPSKRHLMRMSIMTAIAIALHNFPEGFATFITALEDPTIAVPIAVAIAIHNIPEGVAVAVPLREATGSRRKALLWSFLSGLAEPAGALVGFALLMALVGPVSMGIALAGVAGVMVFVSLDELLPTAQATGEHHVAVYGLVLGMAVMATSLLLLA